MKWLISGEEFKPGKRFGHHGNDFEKEDPEGVVKLKKRVPVIDESFIIYKENEKLEVALKNKFHRWIKYDLDDHFNAKRQLNYEIFCGGYLRFYENNFSIEKEERKLYLKWSHDSVEIFISNPVDGIGYKQSVLDFKSKPYEFVNYEKNESIPPPADSEVDPPPPPAPPPPPDA